ncbi:MAG: YggT family protein [Solirubrobacterales bacterium]|nr:YggT family protein [Solirubrobacterales bacterium]
MTLLAIDRGDVADYLTTLIYVYAILIIVRIVLSWVQQVRPLPYNRVLSAAVGFVNDVTDPYLNVFRRFLPPLRIGPGALDLSPTIGLLVLFVLGGIVAGLIRG